MTLVNRATSRKSGLNEKVVAAAPTAWDATPERQYVLADPAGQGLPWLGHAPSGEPLDAYLTTQY